MIKRTSEAARGLPELAEKCDEDWRYHSIARVWGVILTPIAKLDD